MALFELKKKENKPEPKKVTKTSNYTGKGLFSTAKKITNPEIRAKIRQRRGQMLVHSLIYYRYSDSLVDDFTWQKWANELAELQKAYPKESAEEKWAEDFKDWTGDTGAFLHMTDPWVIAKAEQLRSYRILYPNWFDSKGMVKEVIELGHT